MAALLLRTGGWMPLGRPLKCSLPKSAGFRGTLYTFQPVRGLPADKQHSLSWYCTVMRLGSREGLRGLQACLLQIHMHS